MTLKCDNVLVLFINTFLLIFFLMLFCFGFVCLLCFIWGFCCFVLLLVLVLFFH